jgi:hypothetical protein
LRNKGLGKASQQKFTLEVWCRCKKEIRWRETDNCLKFDSNVLLDTKSSALDQPSPRASYAL